jgi:hypothetical protein
MRTLPADEADYIRRHLAFDGERPEPRSRSPR